MDVSGCPLRRREDSIFCVRAEAARGNNVPSGGSRLPLEVVPSPMIDCFSGPWLVGEAFLRKSLVGEKSESLDSRSQRKAQKMQV